MAEKAGLISKRHSYSSIGGGESSGSSSSSDGEEELTRFQKRIFKDSSSNLRELGSADYNQTNFYDMDPEEMDISDPGMSVVIFVI